MIVIIRRDGLAKRKSSPKLTSSIFRQKRKKNKEHEELTASLYQQIGQLKVELDCKAKADRPRRL